MFPAVTVLTQGFLGFGFAAMLTLFAFVASTTIRGGGFAASLVLAYLDRQYVIYMRDRTDIRGVVDWRRT
jgi:hypothetical protein